MEKKWTNTEYVKLLDGFNGVTKYGSACLDYYLTEDRIKHEAGRSGFVGDWYHQKRTVEPKVTNEEYLLSYCGKGLYVADCIGFVKGPLMGNLPGGKDNQNYVKQYDYSIDKLAGMCTDVKIGMKEIAAKGEVGEFMWTEDYGHCAVIRRKGKTDIESAPSTDGVAEVPLNYQPNWYACGKLPFIDYSGVQPSPAPAPADVIKGGDIVKIQNGAVYGGSDKGVPVPPEYCNKNMTVNQVREVKGERCALIEELYSWVPVRYLTKVDKNDNNNIVAGSKVMINKGAKYGGLSSSRGMAVPSEYIGRVYSVIKVENHLGVDEALIKQLNSWVALGYLTLVK